MTLPRDWMTEGGAIYGSHADTRTQTHSHTQRSRAHTHTCAIYLEIDKEADEAWLYLWPSCT